MQLLKLFLILLILVFINSPVLANTDAMLVLDAANQNTLPRHFRMSIPNQTKNVNWAGFADLHIAAGSQFSLLGLKKISEQLNHQPFIIIDLRQESHGFSNGNAISWYGVHNADNEGKTAKEIENTQAKLLKNLRQTKTFTVYKILKKNPDEVIIRYKPMMMLSHDVISEKELAEEFNIDYHRIYAQDFHAPTNQNIEQFLAIVKKIPENHWIFFHCRAGMGRSTTYMVLYDILKNAKRVSFDDILTRQAAIGGKDFRVLPDSKSYKYPFAKERLAKLKLFYSYIKNNSDNFKTSWSHWVNSK